jgi:two-component system cell cycle response regulator
MDSEEINKKPEKSGANPEVISYSDVDSQMGEFARKVELNERILHRLQQYELMLLDAASMPALLDVLLSSTPSHFGLNGATVRLHDPDGAIERLMPDDLSYHSLLSLERDSFDMQRLYGAIPEVELASSEDPRTAQINLDNVESAVALGAVMLPLVRDGILVGSYHWATPDPGSFSSPVEMDFINHLAAIIAICLENCVNAERLSGLSLLDPLTRLSNQRAFEMELRKEISRAQRNRKPLTVLYIEVDEYKDIANNYGHLAGDFTLKTLATHIGRMLRQTDHLAHCEGPLFALLLPACTESKGQEIAERIRSDTEFMEIDDGRGANLFISLSTGLVSWNPLNYPAINMEQLASQIMVAGHKGLQKAIEGGGNRTSVARLTTMLI